MTAERSALRLPALAGLLGRPGFGWAVALIALLLGVPSLSSGLFADDWGHRAFLLGWQAGRLEQPWWDMFMMHAHDPTKVIGLRTSGHAPWWIDPDIYIAFFRPLSVASHHLDYLLWPNTPWLMHLHSLAWHAACCVMAWLVARRVCSRPRVAGIAAIIYTLSFTHVVAWSWLAHRNGLISTFWALAAILAHLRWRSEGSRAAAVAAPLCLGAGLLSAEAGICALAFIAAHELLLASDTPRKRAAALIPAAIVVLAWRLLYSALGYGVSHSGLYIDPVIEPLVFLRALPLRVSSLLTLSVSPPFLPELSVAALGLWTAAAAVVGLALVVFALRSAEGSARFGLLATSLACIPLASSFPIDRVLVLSSLGVALALGELLDAWLVRRGGKLGAIAGAVIILVHVLAPLSAGLFISSDLNRLVGGAPDAHGRELEDEGLDKRGLVVVHADHYSAVDLLTVNRTLRGLSEPNFMWILHSSPERPSWRCVGEQALELRAPEFGWPGGAGALLFRSVSARPFVVGDQVRTLDFTATVTEVDGGRATAVRFEFRAPLAHPSFAWSSWDGAEFRPLAPAELCAPRAPSDASES